MPLLIKSVGVTTYAGFVLLSSILGIMFGLSSLGAGFRAKRFMPSAVTKEDLAQLFYPQLFFNTFVILSFSLLFLLLERPISSYFFQNKIDYSVWTVPVYLLLYLMYSQSCDYFRYTSRVQFMTLGTVCFPYIHIVFISVYLLLGWNITVNMLVISTAIAAFTIAIPGFCVIFSEVGKRISFYDLVGLVSDIRLGFPLMLGFIVDLILVGGDRYFIALYLSITDVGYYVPGYVLGSLVVLIPKAIGTALPQLMCKAVDNNRVGEAQTMLNYSIKIFLFAAVPFIFGCLALSKPILTFLANAEVAEKARWVSPIIALGTLFYGLNIILSAAMFVKLRTSSMFKMNTIAALFSLLSNLILIYFFKSILSAAITNVLSFLIAFIYAYRIVRKEWVLSFSRLVLIKVVVASLAMWIIVSIFVTQINNTPGLPGTIIAAIIGILVYFLSLMCQKTFARDELDFLKQVLFMRKVVS
jgi:O-antigen/teichoic acid export membrane protein